MEDMNAKVGEGRVLNVVGPYGLGTRNENGEHFVDWCVRNSISSPILGSSNILDDFIPG